MSKTMAARFVGTSVDGRGAIVNVQLGAPVVNVSSR